MLFPTALRAAETNISTTAKQAIVIDVETGMVLMEKNADERMPTSSMSKAMTIYMVFEALKKGDLRLDEKLLVSEKAWRKGGSKMFVEVDKYVKVEDLIRGVLIQSGNDATIVLAEGLAGNEGAFAESLNIKAKELGMDNSHFANASGWPDPNHYSTARDLSVLAKSLIRDFPDYYKYFSEKSFTYNNISQKNRNPLLYRDIGADGLKTGHTEDGGYGLIGSGVHNGRRVIVVVNGLRDEKARAQQSAKLLEWGLKRFKNKLLYKNTDIVTQAPVLMGREENVPLMLKDDLSVTVPKWALENFKITAQYDAPLKAPIQEGQEVGVLRIDLPYMDPVIRPLYAAKAVNEKGFISKTFAKIKLFINNL